ncbi:MAG: Rieske (2Fe-2S) protein [bacterium]
MSDLPLKTKNRFIRVADTSQIKVDEHKVIFFQNKEVVIFNEKGEFYALENLCPHRRAPLSAGTISNGVIICPGHGARFDIQTGQGLEGPYRSHVRTYQLKVEGNHIKIAIQSS